MQGLTETENYLNMIDLNRWVEVERKSSTNPKQPKHVPDPYWQWLDDQGHQHRYKVTYGILTLPTLVFVDKFGYFVCKQCGQKVEPGRITVYSKKGNWLVNGKVVEDEVAEAVLERLGRDT